MQRFSPNAVVYYLFVFIGVGITYGFIPSRLTKTSLRVFVCSSSSERCVTTDRHVDLLRQIVEGVDAMSTDHVINENTPMRVTTTIKSKTNDYRHDQELLDSLTRQLRKTVVLCTLIPTLFTGFGMSVMPSVSRADDELARYAAEGHEVGVDGQCFMKKCPLETTNCAGDVSCIKGLACLARCKGGSMCSTGCFAKFGSNHLDKLLQCSVEKNDCVHVPGKENAGWSNDKLADLPAAPIAPFNPNSLSGTWYKVMGLDSRYDCFDCQKNSFKVKGKKVLDMEAMFRIPRPTHPGYLQSKIEEELHVLDHSVESSDRSIATMRSQGEMFGLTFWENWYVLGDSGRIKSGPTGINAALHRISDMGIESAAAFTGYSEAKAESDMKLIFYTGHTLQGSYKGAFLYARTPTLNADQMVEGKRIITESGLNPDVFCLVKNQCFLDDKSTTMSRASGMADRSTTTLASTGAGGDDATAPFWYLGQNFFRMTKTVASELADWFEDPEILSDWLVSQQEKMVLSQPLEVSPFASFSE